MEARSRTTEQYLYLYSMEWSRTTGKYAYAVDDVIAWYKVWFQFILKKVQTMDADRAKEALESQLTTHKSDAKQWIRTPLNITTNNNK